MAFRELSEDPHDVLVRLTESVIPNALTHHTFIVFYLLLLGGAKIAGAIGLIYKQNWGVDLLVGLTLIMFPFQVVQLARHPSFPDFLYITIGLIIAMYLINFHPRAWATRVAGKIKRHHVSVFFIVLSSLLLFPKNIYAAWYYPMENYDQRQTVKGFGQYIDDNFYKGKEALFPYNRFYGYHAAVDLEIFPNELDTKVPAYAISSGTITYVGTLSGYGGVILEKLDNENNTALYGHVKIKSLPFKVGDHVNTDSGPVILTYLGDEFSAETSKERKHLHFGIYKGTDLYFVGHEPTLVQLEKRWFNPSTFLKEKNAVSPAPTPAPTISITNTSVSPSETKNFFSILLSFIRQLFHLQ
jgi:hypothetical protein